MPESSLLVTFNGACFDLPHLRRAFPDWRPPPAHIDLRPVWQRLGQHGGLKALEQSQGFGRPAHLRGLDGDAACWLWRHGQLGNHQALQRFAEYNLYDVINLPPLLGLAYNRLVEKAGLGATAGARLVSGRRALRRQQDRDGAVTCWSLVLARSVQQRRYRPVVVRNCPVPPGQGSWRA